MPSRKTEVSAGVLVYRRTNGLEILLAHPGGPFWARKDDGVWTIPKGLVESGDLLACARREFMEETGLTVKGPFVPLAPVRQKSGKVVHAFAVEADLDLTGAYSNLFRDRVAAALRPAPEFPRDRSRRVFRRRDRDEEDSWLSASVHPRADSEGWRGFVTGTFPHPKRCLSDNKHVKTRGK